MKEEIDYKEVWNKIFDGINKHKKEMDRDFIYYFFDKNIHFLPGFKFVKVNCKGYGYSSFQALKIGDIPPILFVNNLKPKKGEIFTIREKRRLLSYEQAVGIEKFKNATGLECSIDYHYGHPKWVHIVNINVIREEEKIIYQYQLYLDTFRLDKNMKPPKNFKFINENFN